MTRNNIPPVNNLTTANFPHFEKSELNVKKNQNSVTFSPALSLIANGEICILDYR
ncbi:MAG: hypothetical protein OQK57_03355 [Ignavibacteriaceae bacterium]|nr:hypothetical protein [Ignavibacteriaceae bacterium]